MDRFPLCSTGLCSLRGRCPKGKAMVVGVLRSVVRSMIILSGPTYLTTLAQLFGSQLRCQARFLAQLSRWVLILSGHSKALLSGS